MRQLLILALLIEIAGSSPRMNVKAAEITGDVIIYGATSAGIVAAIQVARLGKQPILLEPQSEHHLGGMTTNGLGFTDAGDKSKIGGVAREFYRRIKTHYDQPSAWKWEQPQGYAAYRPDDDAMWTFEPSVARQTFLAMLREAGVEVRYQQRIDRRHGMERDKKHLVALRTESGDRYRGAMFIDASYEGDLLATAGASYTIGREANSLYGETLNGIQPRQNLYNHRFLTAIDPYLVVGQPSSGPIAGVPAAPPGQQGAGIEGAADLRVQAYCFRLCMTQIAANRVPFPKPANYDERDYELLLRAIESGDLRVPFSPDNMPNGKTDTNNLGAMSTDFIGGSDRYPEASYEQRAYIVLAHLRYQQGLLWTLANHPRVPESLRAKVASWGLAADEFTETGNWPAQLYIRESRRLLGEYVMTEHDCRRTRLVGDSIGVGSYNMDSHNCQRYIDDQGHVANEGDVQVSPGGPYRISYRAIVPRRVDVDNLLVPVCLSASHIAYGSIRMEPVFMVLGHSAATAACQAITSGRNVQDLDVGELRRALVSEGQVLE